jgi:hypothetical protein
VSSHALPAASIPVDDVDASTKNATTTTPSKVWQESARAGDSMSSIATTSAVSAAADSTRVELEGPYSSSSYYSWPTSSTGGNNSVLCNFSTKPLRVQTILR